MIFYLKDKKGDKINYVPSSYKVVVLDNSCVEHNNASYLNLTIDKNDLKNSTKEFFKSNKTLITMIQRYILVSKQSQSIVFYQQKHLDYNIAKTVAKLCAKQIDIEAFEFTNNITTDMVKSSKIKEDVKNKIYNKLIKLVEGLKHDE